MPYCADCKTPGIEEDMMLCSECKKWVCVDCYDAHMEDHDEDMYDDEEYDEEYDEEGDEDS